MSLRHREQTCGHGGAGRRVGWIGRLGSTCTYCVGLWVISRFHRVQLCETPWTVTLQASLSVGFSRQEYWNGLPFPALGDLSYPGIEPLSFVSPAFAGRFFTTSAPWEPWQTCTLCNTIDCNFPGSSVHGILQARMLERAAIFFYNRSIYLSIYLSTHTKLILFVAKQKLTQHCKATTLIKKLEKWGIPMYRSIYTQQKEGKCECGKVL